MQVKTLILFVFFLLFITRKTITWKDGIKVNLLELGFNLHKMIVIKHDIKYDGAVDLCS